MNFIKKHKIIFVGIIAGGIAGYLFYYYIGCASGTCAITSKPINSTAYGMLMGGLIASLFKKESPKPTVNDKL